MIEKLQILEKLEKLEKQKILKIWQIVKHQHENQDVGSRNWTFKEVCL